MLLKISKTNKLMFSIKAFLKLQNIFKLQNLVGPYHTSPKLVPVLISIIFHVLMDKLW